MAGWAFICRCGGWRGNSMVSRLCPLRFHAVICSRTGSPLWLRSRYRGNTTESDGSCKSLCKSGADSGGFFRFRRSLMMDGGKGFLRADSKIKAGGSVLNVRR